MEKDQLFTEAVPQRCFVKKVFLEISENSKEKPVPETLFFSKTSAHFSNIAVSAHFSDVSAPFSEINTSLISLHLHF